MSGIATGSFQRHTINVAMMRSLLPLTIIALHALPLFSLSVIPRLSKQQIRPDLALRKQDPMMSESNIVLPPSNGRDNSGEPSGDLIISDVIGKQRVINIFAGFTRDIDTISKRLEDNAQNTTVLAPLNSELQKLPRKPWEDPRDYGELGAEAYSGTDGEDRAHRNLRRFVEAHVIPTSPWKEGEKVESLGGGKIWWEAQDGKRIVRNSH